MKLIGIVGRAYYNRDNQKIIQLNEAIRIALSKYEDVVPILLLPTNTNNYVDIKSGEDKLDIKDKEKLDNILNKCSGFIIPGGSSWYKFDEYIIKHAIIYQKPLLGICAGFQAICSLFSINRSKFDMTNRLSNNNHYQEENKYAHKNTILEDTLLISILKKKEILVNSIHHDYINFKVHTLKISSYSEDGIIEAVELPNHPFFIGIQWHPEYLMDDNSIKIFNQFIGTIKKTRTITK